MNNVEKELFAFQSATKLDNLLSIFIFKLIYSTFRTSRMFCWALNSWSIPWIITMKKAKSACIMPSEVNTFLLFKCALDVGPSIFHPKGMAFRHRTFSTLHQLFIYHCNIDHSEWKHYWARSFFLSFSFSLNVVSKPILHNPNGLQSRKIILRHSSRYNFLWVYWNNKKLIKEKGILFRINWIFRWTCRFKMNQFRNESQHSILNPSFMIILLTFSNFKARIFIIFSLPGH